MAIREIREVVMGFEPDKCRHCDSLFEGMTLSKTDNGRPYPDVTVKFECGSEEWFSTWMGTVAQLNASDDIRSVQGVTGLHVAPSVGDTNFYLRRVLTQKGDCFQIENAKLKRELGCKQERIDALEAEDKMSKERIRVFLRQQGNTRFGPSEQPI